MSSVVDGFVKPIWPKFLWHGVWSESERNIILQLRGTLFQISGVAHKTSLSIDRFSDKRAAW